MRPPWRSPGPPPGEATGYGASTVPLTPAFPTDQVRGLKAHGAGLPAERFAFFEVTEERGGERFDRIAVEPGEIRVADRAYMQPERIAAVLAAGGDVVVRPTDQARGLEAHGWRNAAWRDAAGEPFEVEVAPVWWTPTMLLREVSLWPRPIPPMLRSSGAR